MARDTNSFDYSRRGDPLPYLAGKVDTSGLAYFRRGEPLPAIIAYAGGTPPTPGAAVLEQLTDDSIVVY